MWIDSEKLSMWAYYECVKQNDQKVKNLITDSEWSYLYCKNINDLKEIRDNITDPYWAFRYCKDIMSRPELLDIVKDSHWNYFLGRE